MRQLIKTMDTDGMCNRLFPFAHLIAFAEEHGVWVQHHSFQPYTQYFAGTRGQILPAYTPSQFGEGKSVCGRFAAHIHQLLARLRRKLRIDAEIRLRAGEAFALTPESVKDRCPEGRRLQLSGFYFDATKEFLKHQDIVRAYFRPAVEYDGRVRQFCAAVRRHCDVLVGVHVRHGDYKHHANGIQWYSEAEYADLMRHVESLFPGHIVKFLVATNGNLSADAFDGLSHATAPGHELLDLYSLANCDYIIGPDSTYTEWASFFGRVPRYVHRKKAVSVRGCRWNPPVLADFQIQLRGFSRACPDHPAFRGLHWCS